MPTYNPDLSSVGPIHYEIIEPLKQLRVRLEENDSQPISFDITLHCDDIPPFMENHEFRRQVFGFRVETDLCRYHQVGTPEGWLMIDGERIDINREEWSASRDHSWGVRYGVGVEPTDMMPGIRAADMPVHILWSPMFFHDEHGSPYSIHHFYVDINIPDYEATFHAGVEYPDGTREPFTALRPELIYDSENRRLRGGKLHFTEENGNIRTVEIESVSDTGFHLGAGLYFGYKGFHHGSWRGELSVEGEYIEDCTKLEAAKELHQLRDCIVRVNDNGNIGHAIYQTIINGEWPEYGLDYETSFF